MMLNGNEEPDWNVWALLRFPHHPEGNQLRCCCQENILVPWLDFFFFLLASRHNCIVLGGLDGKESTRNAGDLSLIPGFL